MARIKKMSTVTRRGDRLEMLKNLLNVLADQIDACRADDKDASSKLPALSRQYRETAKEIEELEGAAGQNDEIAEILSERKANGQPGAIR